MTKFGMKLKEFGRPAGPHTEGTQETQPDRETGLKQVETKKQV